MKKILIFLFSIIFYSSAHAYWGFKIIPLHATHVSATIENNIVQELPDVNVFGETNGCDPPHGGIGSFDPSSGNLSRTIKDLEVWGGVGEIPLVLMRSYNSRMYRQWYLSFIYEMYDTTATPQGQAQVNIRYPDGGENVFVQRTPTDWLPARAGTDKRLFQYGNQFYLQMSNGHRYHFEKLTTPSISYRLRDFRDSYQNLYTVTYDTLSGNPRMKISEPAGRFLQFTYGLISGIYVITAAATNDGRTIQFFNSLYTTPGSGLILIDSVKYGDGTKAVYTYTSYFSTGVVLDHAIDPRYEGAAVNMRYTYNSNYNVGGGYAYRPGFIKEEKNGVTGEVMASLTVDNFDLLSANKTVCYPNGRKQIYFGPASAKGLITSYTDGTGNVSQYVYDSAGIGFNKNKTDALGRVTTYDSLTIYGNPLKLTYADGTKERWTRDTLDLVLTHTDQLGRVTKYSRPDSSHRVTRIDYPDTSFETFTYNNFGQVLDHRMQNGGVEHSVFNASGLKTSFTDALGNVTGFTYDAASRLASVTDARYYVTQYEYNDRGLLTKQTNADLSFKKYEYDSVGNQTKITDELNHTWTTVYDEFRRPKTVVDPLNRTTTYSYDLPGGVCGCSHDKNTPTKITLPSGKITSIEYDLEWRKIRQTTGAGTADEASTFYQYDAIGNLVRVIDPKGKQWLTAYDSLNRRKSSTDPLGFKTQWQYDSIGNVLKIIRPDNGITTNVYDNLNRLKQTTDPKGQITKMFYDSSGNLIKMTDPNSHDYRFTYDFLNRKTKMIYPDSSFEQYTYDSVSNLKTYKTRANQVRTYTYDNRNREINSAWSDATPAISRTYDNANRLLSMTSNVSALTYSYNIANELTSETQNVTGGGSSKTITYHYNADALRDTMTYPDGSGVIYTYTARNQLATISTNGITPLVGYSYDVNGNRINKAMNNGTSTVYTYDDANRMLMLDNKKAGISFAKFDYGYDSVSRRKYVKRDNNKGDVYSYDPTDQVTDVKYEATNPDATPSGAARTVNYNWDSVGNRKTVTDNGTPANYTTNNLNQYTSVGANALTHSTNGNLQTFNGWTYTYDAQNRLSQAVKGGTTVTFAYDPMNRCVKRIINGTTYFLYYDGWNLIEERDNTNAQIAKYIHGAMIDEVLTKASPGNAVYYHHDAIGNVIQLTSNAGNVVEKYSYDVFGAATIKDGSGTIITASAYGNRFMFTGREYIQEISLYDYRNRFYSSNVGRFLQTDPIRFDASDLNLYRYVYNDPVNQTDEFGLLSITKPNPSHSGIVCDGKGGIKIQLGNNNKIGNDPCISECAEAFYGIYILTAIFINKDICKGRTSDAIIQFTKNELENPNVLDFAEKAMIDCLKEKLKNNCPKKCLEKVKARLETLESSVKLRAAYKKAYKKEIGLYE